MNCKFFPALLVVLTCLAEPARAAEPFRVFLRGGPKTHGPAGNGLHEHERWLADWKRLLAERGAQVQGAMRFPTAEELAETDVLVMFAAEAGSIGGTDRDNLDKFLKRGGGIVCLHDAVCGTNAHWFKTVIGGAWEHGHSKWYEGDISFYYVNREHPITEGASNFDLDDEVYWDLHLLPEAKVLAASWQPDARNMRGGRPSPHIYNVIPQMWTYEKRHEGGKTHRAFVAIPGHKYSTFDLPHMRAVLLRGIAWAGDRHINELCSPEELASLRYPARGPTAPEKAAASLVVHPEFNLSLVAAEPLVTKPIAMDWDPAGRLWVAETPEYPNGRRGIRGDQTNDVWKDHGGLVAAPGPQQRPARDRISILTDLDGDGRMEKKQVFFEGLELVTGFVFHKDGVIVAQAPDILWLRDVNGDGKAERVEVLYTGLGTFDTHAVINNLRWGFDGWIYATHGYSGTEHVYNGDKSKDFGRIGSGVVRFKPDGSAFEQYSSKGGNTWGLDIAWDNEVFFTQPTSDDLLNHVVLPESVLARGKSGNATSFKPVIRSRPSKPLIKSENLAYVQIDLVGRFTAAAGCAIYDGGTWPTAWNYSYFTTEPTINLVHHEVVQRAGVTYTADKTRDEEFVAGRDLWFRPIETRIGPDGALYVLDFYNQAVIHNDTRGPKHNNVNAAVRPDRDHFFGRIWRLDHQQARKQPVPDLSSAAVKELLDAYEHPNRHVRMNAHRLITELAVPARRQQASAALRALVSNAAKPAYARVLALWTLELLGAITPEEAPLVAAAATDADPAVSRNALKVAARHGAGKPVVDDATLLKALKSPHAQVRLQALLAAGTAASPEVFQAAVDLYPDLDDAWSRSALLATADSKPWEFLQAAFKSSRGRELQSLVGSLTRVAVSRSGVSASSVADLAVQIVSLAAEADAAADPLKVATLTALAENLSRDVPAPKPAELDGAFRRLLTSSNPEVAGAALPLLASWDRGGALAPLAQPVIARLLERLRDAGLSDEQRGQAAASALRARGLDTGVLPAISALLGSGDSADLQRRIITALGATGDAAAGAALVDAYANLSPELQLAAFGQIVTRADWSLALLDALKAGRVSLGLLGPGNIHRLRTHPDKAVAERASRVVDELRGPEVKEKDALVAKLEPRVARGGQAQRGKEVFVQNCGVCHKYEGEGKEVGPDLTGMGVHGVHELLVHILDPNRFVEDNFIATSIETRDDQVFDGIVVRENRAAVTLRNNAGEIEVKTGDIRSRRSTGRSLMPEGFEALGEQALADLLAYMGAGESRFQVLDLRPAFTANSTRGIYNRVESTNESLVFRRFGLVTVEGVPFEIMHPARTTNGQNVVVLKGGSGFAKTLPQSVEFPVGLRASRLHFLGGVGGWAWPFGGDAARGSRVAKITVHYAGGGLDEFRLTNGVEVADYNGSADVPGSKPATGLVRNGQVRYFNRPVQADRTIEKITLSSYDNTVAPTFVAVTAETGGATSASLGAAAAAAAAPELTWGPGTRVLITGGGSSHDFARWFGRADTSTLSAGGRASVNYTEDMGLLATVAKDVDVLYLSHNKPMPDPARRAILDHVRAGKGLLLVHAALWYNWNDWPEYNRDLASGGSRGHDKFGPFEVKLTSVKHPVTDGVPTTFKITDELYWFKPDPQGPPIEVLATAYSEQKKETYPMVFIVKHPQARIVGITLGHDGQAHEHPAYQTLLRNALAWVSGKADR